MTLWKTFVGALAVLLSSLTLVTVGSASPADAASCTEKILTTTQEGRAWRGLVPFTYKSKVAVSYSYCGSSVKVKKVNFNVTTPRFNHCETVRSYHMDLNGLRKAMGSQTKTWNCRANVASYSGTLTASALTATISKNAPVGERCFTAKSTVRLTGVSGATATFGRVCLI